MVDYIELAPVRRFRHLMNRDDAYFFGLCLLNNALMQNFASPTAWFSSSNIDAYVHFLATEMDDEKECILFRANERFEERLAVFRMQKYALRSDHPPDILIPVNVNNNHWILLHVDSANIIINVYDSMGVTKYEPAFVGYLARLHTHLYRLTTLIFRVKTCKTPLQEDGYNCGVAVCYLMHLIAIQNYNMEALPEKEDYAKRRIEINRQMIYHVKYQTL